LFKLKTNNIRKIAFGIIGVVIILCGIFYIYTLDYYRASPNVEVMLAEESDRISSDNGLVTIQPDNTAVRNIGLIFYPGGKVEATAYVPLLKKISDQGITVVLNEMPMNLAVFDIKAADDIYDKYPDISKWYIAGHSLGGVMASSYVGNNSDKVEGLILLGAYPINDADINTLVLYGTHDIKLDLTKLEGQENVVEIVDGNHAYFGDYGEQEGDGKSLISRKKQQEIAVKEIVSFIVEN